MTEPQRSSDANARDGVLIAEREGTRTVLTLNRPDKANSLAAALVAALHDAIRIACADGTTLLVVRGNGRNFCGGFDLASIEAQTDDALVPQLMALERMLQALYYAPMPTVALIHGGAFGAGFDLAMACDYRIACADTRFRMPGWCMGLALGTRRTAQRVGAERAFSFLRDASVIDATQAEARQFITEITDPVAWPRRLDEITALNRALPPGAYARLKSMLLTPTAEQDLADLYASLTATPLKPRMQAYVAARG
ncbi:MAG: enoyl-CoA hydratase/isomerase family protein [Burkholderiales bacterium]|nr:enoyl-CoA hydratase/isomerase family protein [Burkholderiales bacterium]